MADYSRYTESKGNAQSNVSESVPHFTKEITEKSTPKEMAEFVTRQLIASMEADLKAKSSLGGVVIEKK